MRELCKGIGLLADVPKEYAFRCHDGAILRNVKELGDTFNTITDEAYVFHANAKKNDFSNWVEDIIKPQLKTSLKALHVAFTCPVNYDIN